MVRERGVGTRHREGRNLHRAQGERRHPLQRITRRQPHAHLLGDLRLAAEPEALGEGDEVGIGGEGGGLEHVEETLRPGVAHGHGLEGCAVGAVDEVLEGLGVGSVDSLHGREALLKGRREGEDLEGRARLHADRATEALVDVVVVRRLAATLEAPFAVLRHRDDVARPGLDERDGRRTLAGVLDGDVRRRGLHGGGLDIRIKSGADGESTAAQECLALDEGLAESDVRLDHADNEVAEVGSVGRGASVGLDRGVEDLVDPHSCGRAGLDGRDEAGLRHLAEDEVAALLCKVWIAGGIECGGLLDDSGERRALDQVELGCRLGEVAACGSFDSVGAGSEVDDVEVALEDLFLGVAPFECERIPDLTELARRRTRACSLELLLVGRTRDEQILDVLLRDRGAALRAARLRAVGDDRAHGAAQVDARMVEEARVLDGDDGLTHDR